MSTPSAAEVLHLDQHAGGQCPHLPGSYCQEADEANGILLVLAAAGYVVTNESLPDAANSGEGDAP